MTPDELEIARSILSMAGQGWDILVNGTRIDGLASIGVVVATVASGWMVRQYTKRQSWEPDAKFICACALILAALVAWIIIFDGILHVALPEYCVVKEIVSCIGGS